MRLDPVKCDVCETVNQAYCYGDWSCMACGQFYEYIEGHSIRLTGEQWYHLRNPRAWISIADRLPEQYVDVLAATKYDEQVWYSADSVHVASLRPDGRWLEQTESNEVLVVTHWMPLPPPPLQFRDIS